HNRLSKRSTSANLPRLLIGVHVTRFATDEGFIRFDRARHLVDRASVHGVANALSHKPSGSLSNFQAASDFVRTDPILTIGQQPHRAEPLIQADGRILENRSNLDGELLLAVEAFPQKARLEKRKALGFATRACRTLRTPFCGSDDIEADL